MTLASKEMVDNSKKKKQIESVQDRNTDNNQSGVLITVYEESVTPRSRKLSQSQDSIKKTRAHPHFTRPRAATTTTTTTHGYDRRAQLLAHSRQLRNNHAAPSQKVPLPTTIQSQTKSKKGFWLTKPVRICSSCSPSTYMPLRFSSSRCRYELVESQESKERKRYNNKKSSGKACPPFLSKMKKMLKELSCKEI